MVPLALLLLSIKGTETAGMPRPLQRDKNQLSKLVTDALTLLNP